MDKFVTLSLISSNFTKNDQKSQKEIEKTFGQPLSNLRGTLRQNSGTLVPQAIIGRLRGDFRATSDHPQDNLFAPGLKLSLADQHQIKSHQGNFRSPRGNPEER